MKCQLLLSVLGLGCLTNQVMGGSYGRQARGYSRGGGGNKISVGTKCRLEKRPGSGGGGGQCFQEQECGQVCSTVTQTECSTVTERQCDTINVPQCRSDLSAVLFVIIKVVLSSTVTEQQCVSVPREECSVVTQAILNSRN